MESRIAFRLIAVVGLAAVAGERACAQQSIFTGTANGDVTNWCNPQNWSPTGVPADGADVVIPAGRNADMSQCPNSLMILGPVTAGGTIRFYTPVFFAADATLTNPIFEFSSTPIPVSGIISISGPTAAWQGGIFSAGEIRNSGTLLVERSFISGRTAPRKLVDACHFSNSGTMNLNQGFEIQDSSGLYNTGTINCVQSCSIVRTTGASDLTNHGTIEVPAGLGLTTTCGLKNFATIHSLGTFSAESESIIAGNIRLEAGGAVRLSAASDELMQVGPVQVSGVGNLQLLSGDFRLSSVDVSARGENGARGLWFSSSTDIKIAQTGVFVSEGGLLTWSRGTLRGDFEGTQPHIRVAQGGVLSAVGAPGFQGGGDAYDMDIQIEGNMRQYSRVRLMSESVLDISAGAVYSLSHALLDGDSSGSLYLDGLLSVNGDGSGAQATISNVEVGIFNSGMVIVNENDLVTGANGAPTNFILHDDARVTVFSGARWRAFGETIARDGTPKVDGAGILELGSGSTITVGSATLTVDMGTDSSAPGQFTQFGEVRADPFSGTNARFRNEGRWTWRSGAIRFPQGAEAPVVNTDSFTADCGSCQLRSDFLNQGPATILDTLVMAEQGVEFINEAFCELRGFINDATSNLEGKFVNRGILSRSGAASQSVIATTLDNQALVEVTQGVLNIVGPIIQYSTGELLGGRWRVAPGAVMTFGGRPISYVARGAEVELDGAWPEFRPTLNRGKLKGIGNIRTPGMINEGTVTPGHSPGLLTIEGDFTQTSIEGALEIEIAGETPGTQHDVLAVTGVATLGGTLKVDLLDGYVPSPNTVFTVLTAGSVQGDFAVIDAPDGVEVFVERTATSIRIRVACPADFNADNAVDFFDYLDFVQAFADNSPDGDFNHDTVIDFFDYLDFVQAFSSGC